jgi:hypothetical protein
MNGYRNAAFAYGLVRPIGATVVTVVGGSSPSWFRRSKHTTQSAALGPRRNLKPKRGVRRRTSDRVAMRLMHHWNESVRATTSALHRRPDDHLMRS